MLPICFMHSELNYKNFFDISQTVAKDLFLEINYPWEILPRIKDFIVNFGKNLPKNEFDEISENVWISKAAKIANSACIMGPTIIGKSTEIRHCAFIRGCAIIGENCVVGNSTEIKNAILFNGVQVPHFNYIGDSILGYKSHFGAGSIISNVKSDKTDVKVVYDGIKIETGLRKFGAIVGDNVEIGCNAVLNPGTIIGRNSSVYPTSMVRGFIKENVIFKSQKNIVTKQ